MQNACMHKSFSTTSQFGLADFIPAGLVTAAYGNERNFELKLVIRSTMINICFNYYAICC